MKQFIRNFKKQKTVGLLNICSLSLGIMVSVIVGLWAVNELSFDDFHKNKDRMYRIVVHAVLNDSPVKLASNFMPLGQEAKDQLPAVEDMCRIVFNNSDVMFNNVMHPNTALLITDPNFFTFFTFPLKVGDPNTVLSAPDRVVITESAAKKYFPGLDPIGQSMNYSGHEFKVSGIMKDLPANSSLQTEMVFPFFGYWAQNGWNNQDTYYAFITLQKGTSPQILLEPTQQILYKGLELFKSMGATVELEPLQDMHFSSGFMNDQVVKGNRSLIMVFALIALVILVISCINFVNLFISTSFIRAKSIGVKKSYGAGMNMLVREFYTETACYVLISIAVALFLATMSVPVFNNFTQSKVIIDFTSPQLYGFLVLLFVCTVLLAGSFPALYMTRFNTVETLQGKFRGKQVSLFQKSLVVIQFTASITLLIVVGFMQKQVDFMISSDLGFDKENVVYVQGRGNFGKNYDALRDELQKEPTIKNVTMKNSLPTNWQSGSPIKTTASGDDYVMEMCRVEPNYFDFFNMKIIAGENPFHLESSDTMNYVVINERAVLLLGLKQPVDQIITNGHQRFTIKGVVRNAYTRSFHKDVDPQIYSKLTQDEWKPIFFKIAGDPQRAISAIEKKWKEREPDIPFEYHFLDETYKQLYASETNAGKVLAYAMLITLLISIAGLFAMAYYATQRRIREISLRKVNGATLKDLLLLLNKDFIVWMFLSFIIACPVAYFSLQHWLNGFIIKTSLSVWVFLLVGILALLVTLLTTSFQTWKIANTNPVDVLKE